MKKPNKIPLGILLLSILAYSNQGISSLPQQCLYYLTREHWGLSASMIGLISLLTGMAWYTKIVWGYFADKIQDTKKTLLYCYSLMIVCYLYIIFFGLNLTTLIVSGILINLFIGFADTNVDKEMVKNEKKYNLQGRLQSCQWAALGIGGLIVALGGAFIAKQFPIHTGYKVAYGFAGIIPFIILTYLLTKFQSNTGKTKKKVNIKKTLKKIKNKRLLLGLLFVACLQLSPSFGTALMIKVREVLKVDKMFLGYLGSIGTVLGIIGYFIYYKHAYKYPIKKLLYFMIVFSAVTNLFYLYIPNKWFLVGYNIAFGAFSGITFMALLNFFVKIIPKGNEGVFYALVTSVSNFCARGGNLLGGVIYDNLGYNYNVILASGMTLCCLFIVPLLKIGNKE